MAKAKSAVPAGYHTLMPQLSLDNAAETIEWYKRAFGAEEQNRGLGPDGKIMHAEITIGGSRFFVNDVMPGQKGPKALGGSPASLWLYVNDADAIYNRAIEAGATVQVPLGDQFWGDRGGAVADPAGYTWWIASRVEDLTHDEIMARAAEFFKQMAQA
jgi:PhnB protein